jgi:hypothetical protein
MLAASKARLLSIFSIIVAVGAIQMLAAEGNSANRLPDGQDDRYGSWLPAVFAAVPSMNRSSPRVPSKTTRMIRSSGEDCRLIRGVPGATWLVRLCHQDAK